MKNLVRSLVPNLLLPACVFWLLSLAIIPTAAQEQAVFNEAEETPVAVALDELRARLAGINARVASGEIPADPQNLALLKFKLEQAQLLLGNLDSNQAQYVLSRPYEETKIEVGKMLARAESIGRARGDAVYPAVTQVHERAYIARADGSSQPYWVFVPRDFSPRKKWPLAVFLHGYSPSISKIDPWIPDATTWSQFTDNGFVLAVPYGRRNSDFVHVGEDDTLAVTDAVSSRYNIDPDRTFLIGPSMGGFGVYAVGLHHPDRFAALAPMCARTDMYLWFKLQREQVPAWKRVLYDADDPRTLAGNARSLPIYLQHGEYDQIVPTEHSRRFFEDAKKLRLPAYYREIRGGSHYIYWYDATYQSAINWMKEVRRAPPPRRVEYSTGSLRNNRAHWVSVDGFEDYSKVARIEAEAKPGNVVEVKIQNVSRFTLHLPAQFFPTFNEENPVRVFLDGQETPVSTSPDGIVKWPLSQTLTEQGTRKNPRRSGPIKEIYRDPFLLVYGTLKDGQDRENAKRFLKEWYDYADGVPPLKADVQVTDADKQNYNLILFGTRETNAILKSLSDQLPLEKTPTGYRIGETEYSAGEGEIGVQFCYPSPFSSQRMIVVQSGLFWGSALPVNHKLDLLPEFIVFTAQLDQSDNTNFALAAGFFGDDWKLPATITINTPPVEAFAPAGEAANLPYLEP